MRLARNEITIILLGGVVIVGALFYLFVIMSATERTRDVAKYIQRTESDLVEIMKLKGKWESLKRNRVEGERILKQRGKRFALLSYLEGVSRELGISKNIQYLKPVSFPEEEGALQQAGMEVSLEDVDIKQLVNFLYRIEYASKALYIPRFKVKRTSKKKGLHLLKVTLQVNTYIPRG